MRGEPVLTDGVSSISRICPEANSCKVVMTRLLEKLKLSVSGLTRLIELLTKVALRHENVLKSPPSRALFIGFGDSSLDFQLRARTGHTDHWSVIRNELAVGVHKALNEENIEIPFPQRDVNLKIVSRDVAEALGGVVKVKPNEKKIENDFQI